MTTETGDSFPIEGYGDIRLELLSAGPAVRVVMENVAHVPTFKHNQLSVGAAAGQGHSVIFDKDACTLQLKNQEHRYASQNSGARSLSKLARCRRPNTPLLSSLRGLRLPRRLLKLTPTTAARMAIFTRHCSGRQPSKLAIFWKGRCTNAKGLRLQKGSERPFHG